MADETPTTKKREDKIQKIVELENLKKELKARKLLKDIYAFNKEVLKVEEGKDLVPLAPFHKELCTFVKEEGKRQKLILVPRSHLKSSLITVGYTLQRIAENPEVRILIANATYDMAVSFLGQIKKHLTSNETFIDYYGDLGKNPIKWSENMITLGKRTFGKKEATVTAYGVGGNLVSQHYDYIIMDDVVNRDSINTSEQIEKTKLFYKDALDLLEPTGKLLVLGTRWADNDLYGWIMDKSSTEQIYKSFDTFIRKAHEGNLENGQDLKLLWPEKYTQKGFLELKQNKGPLEWSSQYLNDPVPQEDAKFKKEWIRTVLEDELKTREISYYTMIDPAIGQLKSSDKTAMVTIGVDQWNNWFVRNIIWGRFLPNEIIEHVFSNWEVYRPRKIGIEMTAYQKSLQYSIIDEMRRRNDFLPVVELKADRSKQERIEGLIPRYANGSIYHLQQCAYRGDLEDELLRFPRGKHDDIIDALAYGLQIAKKSRGHKIRYRDREDRKPNRYLY